MAAPTDSPIHHMVDDIESGERARYLPRCSCGWSSPATSSSEVARRRWRLHVDSLWARAAGRRAQEQCRDAVRRGRELLDQRLATQARLDELVGLRQQLASPAHRRPPASGPTHATAAQTAYLLRAWWMSSSTMTRLWMAYVALGGNASMDAITAMLHGHRPLPARDHDLLAIALNDLFVDAGIGAPVDYLGSTAVGR